MTMYEVGEPCLRTTYRIAHWSSVILNLALILWAVAAGILSYGASWTPWAIMVIVLCQLIVANVYGDWAMNRDKYNHTYAFLVMQYFSIVILLAFAATAIIDVPKVRRDFFAVSSCLHVGGDCSPFHANLKRTMPAC